LTSVSPAIGPIGTSVTIAGANFAATQGTSTVTFNGIAATPTSWSASSIVVPVPVGATTGNVLVTVSGATSNGLPFTVGVPPSLTSLTPAAGPVGTSVTIAGTNFGTTQGTSTVKFNGTTATPTSWSATSIVVPVPSGATTGTVVVTVNGQASNGLTFTVGPSLTSLTPSTGGVGNSITIAGTNFGTTQGTSTVKFNGFTAAPTSWSASSIVVTVPMGATTGGVVVAVGGLASNALTFTVVNQPPTLNAVTNQTNAESTVVSLQLVGSDPDGNPITYSATNLPGGLSINTSTGLISGTLTYTSAGSYSVTATVSDGSLTASRTFTWTVTNVDRPPVVINPGNQTVADNEGYAQRVVGDTPVSYWRLADTSGTVASDRMGVNNGAVVGSITKGQPGVLANGNQAMRFSGADGTNIQIPASATLNALNGSSALALEAWINPQSLSLPTHYGIFYTFPGSTGSYIGVYNGGGTPNVIVSLVINGQQRWFAAGPTLAVGSWYHVVVTYDGAALTLYVNGTVANQMTGLSGGVMLGMAGAELGGAPLTGGYSFNGLVDEAAIYGYALTPAQIAAHYALRTSTSTSASLQVAASDPDGDTITYGASGLPTGLSINATSGLISGAVSPGSAGTYSVTVTASDGTLTGSQTFTWTVTHTNRPPVMANPGNQTSTVGATVSLSLGATDPDGNPLTYNASGLPSGVTLNTSTGIIGGASSSVGTFPVTVTASDGSLSATQSFSWTIAAVNRPPTLANPGNQSGAENAVVSLQLVGSDPDGNVLTYGATGLPAGLTVNASTGLISGTLSYSSAGSYSVIASVSDGIAAPSTQSFSWTVTNTDRAPILTNPGSQTLNAASSYAQRVISDGPVSYWRFSETSGAIAADSMGLNPGGVANGVTLGQPGAFGSNVAMAFSGADGISVGVPGSSSLNAVDGASAVTLEAWINPTSLALPTHFGIFYSFPGSQASYLAVYNGSGVPQVLVSLMINGTQQWFAAGPALAAGSWYHVAAIYDGSKLVLYVNGVAVGQKTGLSGQVTLGTAGLDLGGYPVAGGYGFSGRVEDTAIYARALTAAQVSAHFGQGTYLQAIQTDTPVSLWRLSEISGTVTSDSAGANTGYLQGGVTLGVPGALANGNPAMAFDGVDGTGISIPASPSLNSISGTSALAIEAWFNPQTLSLPSHFRLLYSFPGQLASYLGVYDGGGSPKVVVSLVINGVQRWFVAGPTVVVGSWYYVVATYDGTQITLYVNGVAVGSMTGLSGPVDIGGGGVRLGGYPVVGSSFSFNGSVDEAALYAHSLSAAQVAQHYAMQTAGSSTGVALQLVATDPDGDPITYSASGLPAGLSVNSTTGLISGTPGGSGSYVVTATASDGTLSSSQTFTLTIP
jgi:hypothetical protein